MRPYRCSCLPILLLAVAPQRGAAQTQETPRLRDHIGIEYGVRLFGASLYRSAIVPRATNYVLAARGLVDPLGRIRTDLAATFKPEDRIALIATGAVSTLEGNRFYGYGNQTEATLPTAFYRLEQAMAEVGAGAQYDLGSPGNTVVVGSFYRFWNTESGPDVDDETDTDDDPGIFDNVQPYGSGRFRQIGIRLELQLATGGPETGRLAGARLTAGGTAYPAVLDVRSPVVTGYGEMRSFLRVTPSGRLTLFTRAGVQRVFGNAPFHDAAYLGGRRTLRGFQTQRFAGDFAVYGGGDLYATLGQLLVRGRGLSAGVMGLVDLGRMFVRGVSAGSHHVGVGGGLWLRDHRTAQEITLSVAQGAGGPRLYVGLGSPFWR